MRPPAKVHYLPHNKISWSPPTVAFLQVVTEPIPDREPETLALTGWAVKMVLRRDAPTSRPDVRTGTGSTGIGLAQWLTESTRGRETTWLFTHNPKLDLVATRLPLELHAAGWSVNDASLSGSAPWVRLGRGNRRLCLVDSFSYLPHTAADLADRLGMPTLKRAPDEDNHTWGMRAAGNDLVAVSESMLDLLEWWDKHQLGKWSISGASTGQHAMRHLKQPYKVVIDPDPESIKHDRAAIYGGRRGAWVIGTRSRGPFLELDFANAYPAVAAGLPLPARRNPEFQSLPLDSWRLTSDRWGIIARVEIQTDVPRWPVRFTGGTFCPTGRFSTVLAGPEIRDAMRLGCLMSVGPGHTHQLNYHQQVWGQWVIGVIRDTTGEHPAAAQLAAKAWSRNVIGKWASRSYERLSLGPSPVADWGFTELWDHETQTRGSVLHLAGEHWVSSVDGDAEQAYPAVFAWIESETRVRLSRMIEAIGEGAVLQCDTDGMIVAERLLGTAAAKGHLRAPAGLQGAARTKWVLDCLDPIIAPLTVRIKRAHKTVRILGPQHVDKPGDRAFSGIPKLATEVAPDVFTYKQWPGLSSQLALGNTGGYVRPAATVRINGPYAPGWVLDDGRVVAPQATIRDDGTNRLLGWREMTIKPKGAKLAEAQHPVLAALW